MCWASAKSIAGISAGRSGSSSASSSSARGALGDVRACRRARRADCMTSCVVADEAHLGVERHVLGQVADGVVRFGSEHRADLVDALEHADHDLLVELRALRQERRSPNQSIGNTFAPLSVADATTLGVWISVKSERIERGTEPADRRRGDRCNCPPSRMAERHRCVVEQRRQLRGQLRTAQLERQRPGSVTPGPSPRDRRSRHRRCLIRHDHSPDDLDDRLRASSPTAVRTSSSIATTWAMPTRSRTSTNETFASCR